MIDLHWMGAKTDPVAIRVDAAHIDRFSKVVCKTEAFNAVPFTYPIIFWNHCDIPWLSNIPENLFLGEQDIQYRRALTVRETVSCQVVLENIVTKQGSRGDMQLLNHVLEIKDEHEEPIVTLTSTLIALPVSINKHRPEKESPKLSPESSPEKGIFLGEFSENRVDSYANSSGDLNIIHMNDEYAKQLGFPARIVHGMLIMGAAAHHLQLSAKENLSLTGLHMRFSKPVFAGDVLYIQTESCERSQSFEVFRKSDVCCTGHAEFTKQRR